jgi:hypothetical protein
VTEAMYLMRCERSPFTWPATRQHLVRDLDPRAISFVPIPSAATSTIRARIDGDLVHEASTSRSRRDLHSHSQRHEPKSANHRQRSRFQAR